MSIIVPDSAASNLNNFATESINTAGAISLNTNNAYLFVYSPRVHTPQYRRSNLYNFNNEFLSLANDFAYGAKVGEIQNIKAHSMLRNNPLATGAIKPSAVGSKVEVSYFDEMWSFMLVIDILKGTPIGNMSFSNIFDKRIIIIGYVNDEPINPVSHGNGHSLNPNAILIPTHRTVVSQIPTISGFGIQGRTHVDTDKDVVNGEILTYTNTEDPILMSPDNLVNSISFGEGSSVFISEDAGTGDLSINYAGNSTLNTRTVGSSINAPRYHLSNLLFGTSYAINQVKEIPSESIFDESEMSKPELFQNILGDSLRQLSDPSRGIESFSSSRTEASIMMSDLMMKYPNMQVTDCRIPKISTWDASDQRDATVYNIASALVSSSLPAIMSGQAISQIAFRYCSLVVNPNYFNGAAGSDFTEAQELYSMATFVPMDNGTMKSKFVMFMQALKDTVFPAVLDMGGHFDLTIHASVAGVTLIKLHFLDDGLSNANHSEVYESTSSLGGIISPTVGSKNEYTHNVSQISNLISTMANTVY